MSEKQEYTVKADGWVAGKWRPKGSTVPMTSAEAKYENVALETEEGPKVELTGSLDDPTVKSTGLAEKAKAETTKRSRRAPSSSKAVGQKKNS
ncbi:MAG: hypothetical protein OQK00_09345 [Rhodobacteraceae bacterium]|nr:hypothetical protein [Paracoccaceae bacterium]MCW9041743.1 hypothetical protein [Pseudopelagicola sp.]